MYLEIDFKISEYGLGSMSKIHVKFNFSWLCENWISLINRLDKYNFFHYIFMLFNYIYLLVLFYYARYPGLPCTVILSTNWFNLFVDHIHLSALLNMKLNDVNCLNFTTNPLFLVSNNKFIRKNTPYVKILFYVSYITSYLNYGPLLLIM